MRKVQGAVAVITGAGSGIGRALARDLASRGAQLALADVNSAGLDETANKLGSAKARTYVVDVSSPSAVHNFARAVEQDFGKVSLLINNAGVALYGTFAELTLEEMQWLININFWGVIHGCKFFLPLLQRQPEAHIVNISSVFGLIGPPGQSMYASSKFAVRGFSESLREELRSTGVRVTCVHPAGIATRIAENARPGAATRVEEYAQVRERFAQVATIPPAEAAQVIMRGILGNKDRVLIGRDAYRIDFLQRLLPLRANGMLSAWLMKRIEKDAERVVVAAKQ
ncbi:MAG TPA: SDR family NAD(P)-dependent oxidoreductase [Candidatus Angelobacter sp.]|nr:SDR family NAD(P)-dependent oxidoreductase [Candidatus Angelobacter sp.]